MALAVSAAKAGEDAGAPSSAPLNEKKRTPENGNRVIIDYRLGWSFEKKSF
jgi:hypothetical protein